MRVRPKMRVFARRRRALAPACALLRCVVADLRGRCCWAGAHVQRLHREVARACAQRARCTADLPATPRTTPSQRRLAAPAAARSVAWVSAAVHQSLLLPAWWQRMDGAGFCHGSSALLWRGWPIFPSSAWGAQRAAAWVPWTSTQVTREALQLRALAARVSLGIVISLSVNDGAAQHGRSCGVGVRGWAASFTCICGECTRCAATSAPLAPPIASVSALLRVAAAGPRPLRAARGTRPAAAAGLPARCARALWVGWDGCGGACCACAGRHPRSALAARVASGQ